MKMELMNKVVSKVSRVTGKAGLKVSKYSPEIYMGIGIVSFAGSIVTACAATLHCDEVLDFHKEQMEHIHEAQKIVKEHPEYGKEYGPDLVRKDKAMAYLKTAVKFGKLYAPTIALATVSIGCFLASRNILQKRYLGVVAAYNGLAQAFEQYRRRVIEDYNEDLDRHFMYGTTYTTSTESVLDENGNKVKTKYKNEHTDKKEAKLEDTTARWFDKTNPNWNANPNFSMMFLQAQERMANDVLHSRGHIFLNEVYDSLGIDHTPEGAVLGWVEGEGDDYVSFGIYNARKDGTRKFVNGEENVILLEFNHAGVIYDKI